MAATSPSRASLAATLARVAVVLGALGAVLWTSFGAPPAATSAEARYACPMHPEITSQGPSDCSLCGMALELVASKKSEPKAVPRKPRYGADPVRGHVLTAGIEGPAWVEGAGIVAALLYADQLASLAKEDRAVFASPAGGVEVAWTGEAPAPKDDSTSVIRLQPTSSNAALPGPGALGRVAFEKKNRSVLVVPSSSVLVSREGPYVLVAIAEDAYEARPIRVGEAFNGLTTVVSGVRPRELVVSQNAFFLDAERRARSKVAP